jgi:hypothetical protein
MDVYFCFDKSSIQTFSQSGMVTIAQNSHVRILSGFFPFMTFTLVKFFARTLFATFLYMFGGIYADMDAECLQPLASKPRQEFWLLVIWLMMDAVKDESANEPEYLTGPVLLKSAVDLYLAEDR